STASLGRCSFTRMCCPPEYSVVSCRSYVPPRTILCRFLDMWVREWPRPTIPRSTLGRTTVDPPGGFHDLEGRGGPPGRPPLFTLVTAVSWIFPWPRTVASCGSSLAELSHSVAGLWRSSQKKGNS